MNNKQIEHDYWKQKKEAGDLLEPFQRSPVEVEPLTPAQRKVRMTLYFVGIGLAGACVLFAFVMGY